MNETFLTRAVEEATLEGYETVVRRDRKEQWGGGIILFVSTEYAARITLLLTSESAERAWAVLHAEQGPFLIGLWYRPPAPGNLDGIDSFEAEWQSLRSEALGTIMLGDVNVHSTRWLKHSARESPEGTALFNATARMGF